MKMWALGGIVTMIIMGTSGVAYAQEEECPMGRPTQMVRGINSVVGETPFWASVGRADLVWRGEAEAQTFIFLRDYVVRGPITLTGEEISTGAKPRFAASNLALTRNESLRLDPRGEQPANISTDDLRAYTYNRAAIWFPEPGCYVINAQIGLKKGTLHLEIHPPEEE